MIRKIKYIVGNFSKEKAAENILPTEFVILNMEPYKGRDCYYRKQIKTNVLE